MRTLDHAIRAAKIVTLPRRTQARLGDGAAGQIRQHRRLRSQYSCIMSPSAAARRAGIAKTGHALRGTPRNPTQPESRSATYPRSVGDRVNCHRNRVTVTDDRPRTVIRGRPRLVEFPRRTPGSFKRCFCSPNPSASTSESSIQMHYEPFCTDSKV
jgi:hypothetical protein